MIKNTVTVSIMDDHTQRKSDWISIARQLYKLKQTRKELVKQEGKLQEELKVLSEDKNAKGGGFAFTCFMRKGSVEYAKVKELEGIDLEPYRKGSVLMWKLSKI